MDRPRCADSPPDVEQPVDLLKKLLAIELERLDVAVRIEKERKIVFPETTVIIRDILRLRQAINGKQIKQVMIENPFDWLENT